MAVLWGICRPIWSREN